MDCKQLREVVNCYVDGELSPESMAAADAHVHACRSCARVVNHLNALRTQVKRVVEQHTPPQDLERRVARTLHQTRTWRTFPGRVWRPIAAAIVVLIGVGAWAAHTRAFNAAVASGIDRLALYLDDARDVEFEATLLCRDCELERRHGIRALCPTIGHHGALATADGRIRSIVEQPDSIELIHNSTLLGTKVRVRARTFRSASSVSVRSYELMGPAQLTRLAARLRGDASARQARLRGDASAR